MESGTKNRGLVLEGGAMRGLFTCGIIDVLMEHDVWPDGLVGVSAGAAFGCNYKSRQPGRAIRYNMRFARDSRYSGLGSLLTTGDYFNAQFAYHTMPRRLDVFDGDAFCRSAMAFYVVCTDVLTGKAVYKQLDTADDTAYDWIRASASMPLASRVVRLEGQCLLDGGVADSIPLAFLEGQGYERCVVILTQPLGYVKKHSRLMPLMRLALRRYPQMVAALDRRHSMYNAQLSYVAQAEAEGRCLVIRPADSLPIGHICHDARRMEHVYRLGREMGERELARIMAFWNPA